jgi:hypothetical protein
VSQRDNSNDWIVPTSWALIMTLLMGRALVDVSWPFVDLYNNFYKATAFSWRETLTSAFGGGVEYRPLLIIGMKLVHQLVGLRAWFYKTLVLLQFAALLIGLVWIFLARTGGPDKIRPTIGSRAIAACIALATVVGLHTSRVLFMFAPLNAHSFGVLLLLAGIVLALGSPEPPSGVGGPRSRLNEWAFLPLTLVALLLLESGALIVAVTLVLWRMKAPGVSGRALTATLIAAAVYLVVRVGLGAPVATSTYTETGLGFGDVSAQQLGEIFANAPWLLWLYNVVASLFTVAASEPRAGRFLFVEAILHGHIPLWMYVHVVTSVVTTGVIVWALATSRISTARDRCIAAAGVTVVVLGSALGFLYTRDRIALSAGIGYAMLVYVAVVAVLEGRPELKGRPKGRPLPERLPARGAGLAIARVCVAVMAAGWLIRTGEAYFQLRDAAWENHQEWTTRYEELGGLTRPQTDVLTLLRSAAVAKTPDDPRRDPAWSYVLFEREFERIPE